MTFGEKLAGARRHVHLTQVELAEACEVDERTVQRWEADDGVPSWAAIRRISQALSCPLDYWDA